MATGIENPQIRGYQIRWRGYVFEFVPAGTGTGTTLNPTGIFKRV